MVENHVRHRSQYGFREAGTTTSRAASKVRQPSKAQLAQAHGPRATVFPMIGRPRIACQRR